MAHGSRYWRHIVTDHHTVRRIFSADALSRIEHAIADSEKTHGGQIVFAVEPALPLGRVHHKLTPRERALEVFGLLRVWDTEHNNGVLIYLLLADHDVEIVADRGIANADGDAQWQAICGEIERDRRHPRERCRDREALPPRRIGGAQRAFRQAGRTLMRRPIAPRQKWVSAKSGVRDDLLRA